jgi:hypothetical protein
VAETCRGVETILQPSNVKALKSASALAPDDVCFLFLVLHDSLVRTPCPSTLAAREDVLYVCGSVASRNSGAATHGRPETSRRRQLRCPSVLTRQLDCEARESSWGAGGGCIRSAVHLRQRRKGGQTERNLQVASHRRVATTPVLFGKM